MEEIEWLDDELTSLTADLTEKIKEITTSAGKKMAKTAREERFAYIIDRLARAKDVLATYRVELRTVMKEVGKGTWTEYDGKGKEHNANINKLSADFEAAKKAAETRDLMEDAKKRKKNKGKDIEPVKESDEIMEEAKKIQLKSATALAKSTKLVSDMENMGLEQNQQLAVQSEQIKSTHSDVDRINEGVERASKQVRDIGRRLATDKLIMCMVLLVFLLIVFLVVSQFMGWGNPTDIFKIDCELEYNKASKACIDQQMAKDALAEALAEATGIGGGGGGGGGQNAENSTRREFIETVAPFLWASGRLASLDVKDDLERTPDGARVDDVDANAAAGDPGVYRQGRGTAAAIWGMKENVRVAMASTTRFSSIVGGPWAPGTRRHDAADPSVGSVDRDGRTKTADVGKRRSSREDLEQGSRTPDE